jgi:formamidopyrimidine-DNA glycosylase
VPEYPEIVVYVERLRRFAGGQPVQQARLAHPFLLRTADPPIESLEGLLLEEVEWPPPGQDA